MARVIRMSQTFHATAFVQLIRFEGRDHSAPEGCIGGMCFNTSGCSVSECDRRGRSKEIKQHATLPMKTVCARHALNEVTDAPRYAASRNHDPMGKRLLMTG